MILTLFLPLLLFSSAINGLALVSPNVGFDDTSDDSSTNNLFSTTHSSTESLLTRLYQASLTGLRRRQDLGSRPINSCRSSTANFVHSHCVHSAGMVGSMQSYLVICRERNPTWSAHTQTAGRGWPTTLPASRFARPTSESGRCYQDEVCMNGQMPGVLGTSVAYCVKQNKFMAVTRAADDGLRRTILKSRDVMQKGGLINNAVISDDKGMTPIKVPEIDLAFQRYGNGTSTNSSSVSSSVETQVCTNCSELIPADFTTDTKLLTADVRVAGTAAATGILWLAFLSG